MDFEKFRKSFVTMIYADHNSSRQVRRALEGTLATLGPDEAGLNLGAGDTRIHQRIQNMDIFPGDNIDIIGRAEAIPVADNVFKVVITQEVLEHVEHPFIAVDEIFRVLKPGGLVYCQLPFVIGYHPGPTDFWRFTKEGIVSMLTNAGFEIKDQGISVGGGTGFYRIAVEFFAILFSLPVPKLYKILKGVFACVFYPCKWLDFVFALSNQPDRIAGGYYVIARKPE